MTFPFFCIFKRSCLDNCCNVGFYSMPIFLKIVIPRSQSCRIVFCNIIFSTLVNISRHKFTGLIGYDLIWCLYCDWMTGVWSLGTEMLRNVESFWCPIRFYNDKKCENCKIDFPNIDGGWVESDRNMQDVTELLNCKYAGVEERSWFAHKSRQQK